MFVVSYGAYKTCLTLVVSDGAYNTYLTLVVFYGAYKTCLTLVVSYGAYYSRNSKRVVASGLRATMATNAGGSSRKTGPKSA